MRQEEWVAMHLESHNILPEECELCLRGEGMIILKLDNDKGIVLCHESEIKKIENE